MSEVDDFLRSARAELLDVTGRIVALAELPPGRPLIRNISAIHERLCPLLAEARRYRRHDLVDAISTALAALDAAREREIDGVVGCELLQ